MKKFAIFLPQFHEIEENNLWWGKGYTEWTAVKSAKPLFKGHLQPKIPQNGYYNLLDKDTMIWQTELAKKNNIDGFVYYHYYFSGKLIMEKPVANLLQWKDIDQKFFFCWANHTWVKGKGKDKIVLIEQSYGDRMDWENHFQYFLPYFKDERYEKKDGKPLLMIYVSEFPHKNAMLQYFDERCRQEGMNGIYIIETYTGDLSSKSINRFKKSLSNCSSCIYYREPNVSTSIYFRHYPLVRAFHKILREKNISLFSSKVAKIDGKKLYNLMLHFDYPRIGSLDISHGCFFEWDNTPRHKNKGYIISPPEKSQFDDYIKKISSDEYCFINAWNEWAEGMMLEPVVSGTDYLKWLCNC